MDVLEFYFFKVLIKEYESISSSQAPFTEFRNKWESKVNVDSTKLIETE